jgi:hypothetical protein
MMAWGGRGGPVSGDEEGARRSLAALRPGIAARRDGEKGLECVGGAILAKAAATRTEASRRRARRPRGQRGWLGRAPSPPRAQPRGRGGRWLLRQ